LGFLAEGVPTAATRFLELKRLLERISPRRLFKHYCSNIHRHLVSILDQGSRRGLESYPMILAGVATDVLVVSGIPLLWSSRHVKKTMMIARMAGLGPAFPGGRFLDQILMRVLFSANSFKEILSRSLFDKIFAIFLTDISDSCDMNSGHTSVNREFSKSIISGSFD
jgi:hypothetical protein